MVTDARLQRLLQPYEPHLTLESLSQLRAYLDLLMRWNKKINLTAIRDEEEAITRHFGESLFLAQGASLQGRLLDVGSGAGFPGLALKFSFPELSVTLLEPVAKKRAFLKEVVRTCGFKQVEVRSERLEDFATYGKRFEAITTRAVGNFGSLIGTSKSMLSDGGKLILWVSRTQAQRIKGKICDLSWIAEVDVPGSCERVILTGCRSEEVL